MSFHLLLEGMMMALSVSIRKCFVLSAIGLLSTKTSFAYDIPDYYHNLSGHTQVPVRNVFALAKTESNTRLNTGEMLPWPWTINHAGKSYRFVTYGEMISFAHDLIADGILNFDIGLFQVNWYWEGRHRIDSISELGKVDTNGLIAMEIYRERYSRTQDWTLAAGAYHNPANKNGAADRYIEKYLTHLTALR